MYNPLQWPWIWMRLPLYSTSTQAVSETKTWMAFSQVMYRHRRIQFLNHLPFRFCGRMLDISPDIWTEVGVWLIWTRTMVWEFSSVWSPEYYLFGKEKKTSNLCKCVMQQVFISCAEMGRKQLQPLPLLEWRTVYCLYCTVKKNEGFIICIEPWALLQMWRRSTAWGNTSWL